MPFQYAFTIKVSGKKTSSQTNWKMLFDNKYLIYQELV
jgi:hypothetical protein